MAKSWNHFSKVANAIRPACKQVVAKTALDIQAQAVSKAPVDTGFLRNSIYTVTSDSSSYKAGDKSLPQIDKPSSETEAYVAVGAEYGVYVEYGTVHAPAQPYFHPAVEDVRPGFEQAMQVIVRKMYEAAK